MAAQYSINRRQTDDASGSQTIDNTRTNPYVATMASSSPVPESSSAQSAAQSPAAATPSNSPAANPQTSAAPAAQSSGTSQSSSAAPSNTRSYNGVTYDTSRDYADEALAAINGVSGQYDPTVYSNVRDWYAARNAKISDNQSHYDAAGISSSDAAGQSMSDYLNRYASRYQTSQSQQAAQQSAQQQKISGVDLSGLREVLDQWLESAHQRSQLSADYTVSKGINELARTQQDAQEQFQTQQNQIDIDEARARDNQALRMAAQGNRGGIGNAQYDSIAASAAVNRQTVRNAQTKLATDVQRQMEDLRAQGEFQKADDYLNITQQYLSQLMQMEQFAIQTNLSIAQFNAGIDQWYANYALQLQQMQISVDQWQAEFDNQNYWNQLNFDEGVRQYNQNYAFQIQQFAEQIRQYDRNLAFQMEQFAESVRQNDRNFAYQQQRDAVSDSQWNQQFAYQQQRDAVSDSQWNQQFQENSRQFWTQLQYTAQRNDRSDLAQYAQMLVQNGVMPADDTLRELGWLQDKSALQTYADYVRQQQSISDLLNLSKIDSAAGTSAIPGTDTSELPAFYTTKPNLTFANVNDAIEEGNVTENVRQAYAYYYGESYFTKHENKLSDAATDYLNAIREQSGLTEEQYRALEKKVKKGDIKATEIDYLNQILRTFQTDTAAPRGGWYMPTSSNAPGATATSPTVPVAPSTSTIVITPQTVTPSVPSTTAATPKSTNTIFDSPAGPGMSDSSFQRIKHQVEVYLRSNTEEDIDKAVTLIDFYESQMNETQRKQILQLISS